MQNLLLQKFTLATLFLSIFYQQNKTDIIISTKPLYFRANLGQFTI